MSNPLLASRRRRLADHLTRRRRLLALGALAAVIAVAPAAAAEAPPLEPLDLQDWTLPDDMTWDEYRPVPGTDWANPSLRPTVAKWRTALVVVDFPDQPFVISQPTGSTIFGNPQPGAPAVPRDDVPEFYRDFLNTPSMLNNFVTMNKYWMENSLGRYGVEVDAFGPYRMPGNQFQYFLNDAGGAGSACPTGFTCNRNIRTDARAAWVAEVGTAVANSYDNIFYLNAGQDESGTWQEFGEMKFQTREDVTDAFGNPDQTKPNWAPTRYVPWTSFAAAQSNWPNASGNTSTEAESSGMGVFAHELSHNLGIADNYNNPYGMPLRRSYTGPWDMLSRGSFNGPGGPHTRWHIPARQGASLGSNHNLRNRIKLGIVAEENVLRLDRNALATSGTVVATLTARAADPGPAGLTGVNLALTGGDRSPVCDTNTKPDCPGPAYDNYTLEVVQRIGNDSFTPGHGVLISKTKNADTAPFVWIMDAHPEDIGLVDFRRPDGTPAMISFGDYRQLSDATFNAGLDSGSKYEYADEANSLHFYVVDVHNDGQGILSYTVAVRSLSGDGLHERGVSLGSGSDEQLSGVAGACSFPLTNTGTPPAASLPLHPENVSAYTTSDVYRLSASVEGAGWSAQLRNALAAVRAGQTTTVPVYVTRTEGSARTATVTLTATSESDPAKSATSTCAVAAPVPVGTATAGGGWLSRASGAKLNFGFDVEQTPSGPAGELSVNDRAAGAKIALTNVTFIGPVRDGCGSIADGPRALELNGTGTYNGTPASFRVCVEDNGEGAGAGDRFHVSCDCGYETDTGDDVVDGGNIQVVRADDAPAAGEPQASTVILEPVLASDAVVGSPQTFAIRVYDRNHRPLGNARVELVRTTGLGVRTLTALTGADGTAVLVTAAVAEAAEYGAAVGGVRSNTVRLTPLLG